MSAETNDAMHAAPGPRAPLSAFYWSVRRELWEHRAIWVAPVVVAAFAVVVHFLSAMGVSDASRQATLAGAEGSRPFMQLYHAATGVIVVAGLLVGALYCAGALHGERRDRSFLFWKSLPVSDRTAVLAKAAVPMLVLPLTVLATVVVANLLMLLLQTAAWSLRGYDPGELWARLDLPYLWVALLYGLPFMALWYAPLYAWLLFVSGWAQRTPLLWGAAPFAAMLIVEHVALHHTPAHWMLERWLGGGVIQPYTIGGDGVTWIRSLADLEPARIYTLPLLWIGLAFAALLLVGAVHMRRTRGPV